MHLGFALGSPGRYNIDFIWLKKVNPEIAPLFVLKEGTKKVRKES